MDESMSPTLSDEAKAVRAEPRAITEAAWHSLLWLCAANIIGVGIAALLLLPGLNAFLGEWTYGRWIMVRMNLELYGWTSLPFVALLFRVYGADRGMTAKWCRPVLWVWSAALGGGVISWLCGHSRGMLLLAWGGYARWLFADALQTLWLLLIFALLAQRSDPEKVTTWAAKLAGLTVLFAAPFAIYIASSPNLFPAVNLDTAGPTDASQLESSLMIVLILLMIPFGVTERKSASRRVIFVGWTLFTAEAILCIAIGHGEVSSQSVVQYLSLCGLVVWIPLVPAYYAAFRWNNNSRRWRLAFLWWWSALLLTCWIFFLPGVFEHFKFTDGLVDHSFVAIAGFTSSVVIFLLIQLMGDDGGIFNRPRSFYAWHAGVIVYILAVTLAGWREGHEPACTIVPGTARNVLYAVRLISGIFMLLASLDWFVDATIVLHHSKPVSTNLVQEQTV